ncbi:MAG: MlaE family lipid ABC transporter permease subunit [Deltaproteobacteria bacterium]|jgi:phospholipid/cholesterol/gamma-HCH transport system permease protein|nr:MlaE family lipid ABC transporter permease subunit [Deltaproteobacteria bacterium]
MSNSPELQSCRYEVSNDDDGAKTLHIQGRMDATTATETIAGIKSILTPPLTAVLTVDLEKVTYMDDFGALVLVELKTLMARQKSNLILKNADQRVKEILKILKYDALGEPAEPSRKPSVNMFVRLGEAVFGQVSDLNFIFTFIGSVCLSLIYACLHPRSLRFDDIFSSMKKVGVDALPIVGLISFLLGLIMAFMSSVQLQQFGANIYVASLVSLAMVRELGPIMTAIIVAGRSGSAFAAEIGTMKISDEVDALFTMGFDPTRFLVVPKIFASVITVPTLTLFSNLFAIMGGLVVGVFMLDLTTNAYMTQTMKTLKVFDVFWGFLKAAVFALLIAGIGCLRRFQVRGGAAEVGQATTSAVVSSIFLIILADAVFAVILRYWG